MAIHTAHMYYRDSSASSPAPSTSAATQLSQVEQSSSAHCNLRSPTRPRRISRLRGPWPTHLEVERRCRCAGARYRSRGLSPSIRSRPPTYMHGDEAHSDSQYWRAEFQLHAWLSYQHQTQNKRYILATTMRVEFRGYFKTCVTDICIHNIWCAHGRLHPHAPVGRAHGGGTRTHTHRRTSLYDAPPSTERKRCMS